MVKRIELLPNVYLSAIRTEKFKTGCFSVNFLRPLSREEAALNALLPSVLLRGNESCPDMQSMALALERLFGAELSSTIRKKGEVQTLGLFADFIEDALADGAVFAPVVAFAAETLLRPALDGGAFRAEYVEQEKENLRNAILSAINSKRAYAVLQTVKAMCADEPYGVPRLGEAADVDAITPQTLFAHYRKVLETSRVEICYLGRKSAEEAASLFRTALAALPRGAAAAIGTTPNPVVGQVRERSESLDVTQGKLCMGFRLAGTAAGDDWASYLMMNAVFGSGVTSKLFANVREKMSLCYYASSSLEKFKGVMLVDSGIEFANAEVTRREILRQLDDCRSGAITETEMDSTRKHLLSVWRAAMDSPSQMDEYYLGQAILGRSETMADVVEQLAAVTKEQAVRAANGVTLDTVYFLKGSEA